LKQVSPQFKLGSVFPRNGRVVDFSDFFASFLRTGAWPNKEGSRVLLCGFKTAVTPISDELPRESSD
jgi:hypothetical protein